MKTMTNKAKKTLDQLKLKAESSYGDKARMPSVKAIAELLKDVRIDYYFSETTNVVENRTAGRTYVNSRHDGKSGYLLKVNLTAKQSKLINSGYLELDTSDSYYSMHSRWYARDLVKLITGKK